MYMINQKKAKRSSDCGVETDRKAGKWAKSTMNEASLRPDSQCSGYVYTRVKTYTITLGLS